MRKTLMTMGALAGLLLARTAGAQAARGDERCACTFRDDACDVAGEAAGEADDAVADDGDDAPEPLFGLPDLNAPPFTP